MEKLTVKDTCRPCSLALSVREDDGIETAIRRFAQQPETHVLFVVDKEGKLQGMVKIRHLLNWVRMKMGISRERHNFTIAEAFDAVKLSQSNKIGDIISPVVSVKREDSLGHALNLMANEEVVELAIVDDEGRLAGEVKLTDIMTRLLDFSDNNKKNENKK